MELYFKHHDTLNISTINSLNYAVTPNLRYENSLCHEYDIIKKINENKDGFFDFSKNLIDIGPEDGGYSILCNFKNSFCFEPNKEMCCLIYTNMYLKSKVNNVFVYNTFLSDKRETINFDGFEGEGTVNFGKPQWRKGEITQIKTTLLDDYNINNVGLLKIDTEGYDYFVLNGAINTIINNNYPPILFENWNIGQYGWSKESHDQLNNLIISLGYTIFEKWGSDDTHLAIKLNK